MIEDWPAADLEAVDACPVCGARERTSLETGLTDRVFGIAPGRWDLARCTQCGAAYLDPRPTPDTIGRAYAGAYVTHAAPQAEPPPATALARVRRSVRNGYANGRFGLTLRPASPLGRLLPALPPLHAATDRAFRHLARPAPGARLLDVGCGNGAAVRFLAQVGWAAEGQEIDPDAVAQAHAGGVTVHAEPLAALASRHPGRYAAVTLSHVIEHAHDPPEMLALVRRLLAPHGRIWIATPNLDAAGRVRYGADWMALDPPRHLVLFTRASLARALTDAGFEDVSFPAPWSEAGTVLAGSRSLREGRRPGAGLGDRGSPLADAVALARPRRAEELVVTAARGPGAG